MAPELTNKYQKVDRDMGENQGKEPSRSNKVAGRKDSRRRSVGGPAELRRNSLADIDFF